MQRTTLPVTTSQSPRFFWGALIFLALFVACFLVWKAIEWLRNRGSLNGIAASVPRDVGVLHPSTRQTVQAHLAGA